MRRTSDLLKHHRIWCYWCECDLSAVGLLLAHNIAIGAGLCATFTHGFDQRTDIECARTGVISPETQRARYWYPGCGKPAS